MAQALMTPTHAALSRFLLPTPMASWRVSSWHIKKKYLRPCYRELSRISWHQLEMIFCCFTCPLKGDHLVKGKIRRYIYIYISLCLEGSMAWRSYSLVATNGLAVSQELRKSRIEWLMMRVSGEDICRRTSCNGYRVGWYCVSCDFS